MLWILDKATGKRYADKWEAAKALGISATYASRLAHGKAYSSRYNLAIYDDGTWRVGGILPSRGAERPRKAIQPRTGLNCGETICMVCDNYRCRWIQLLEPVEGWEAEDIGGGYSYVVKSCPEFKENERRKKHEGIGGL